MQLSIPDDVVQAIWLPEQRLERELTKELAIALYGQELLCFGKARELAQMGHYEFSQLLASRDILRHYGAQELSEYLTYGGE